jgi:hypothetical protein
MAVLAAGCSTDVCAPFGGQTCIALEVKGAQQIDQLGIAIDMVLSRQLTPGAPRVDPVSLPVWVAVLPGENFPQGQPLRIFVDALLRGNLVGQALGELTMTPGQHVSAAISLTDTRPDMAGGI